MESALQENRLRNLRVLRGKESSKAAFAKRLGMSESWVAQMCTSSPDRKSISESTARDIEAKLGLPVGYLDRDIAFGGRSGMPRDQRIADIVAALQKASANELSEIEYVLALDLI